MDSWTELGARMWKQVTITAVLALVGLGCQDTGQDKAPKTASLGAWGVETRFINPLIQPGDDFFRYVNDGWLESAVIPEGLPRMDSFISLSLRTEQQLQQIIEDLPAERRAPGSSEQQLADLHASFMDLEQRETQGLTGLKEGLAMIADAANHAALLPLMARPGFPAVADFSILLDPDDPSGYRLFLSQSGTGLPSRDYYLSDEAPYPALRDAYVDYVAATLGRAGAGASTDTARAVLDFETALARVHWTPAQSRDVIRNTHRMTPAELQAYAPQIDWLALLAAADIPEPSSMIVSNDTAVRDGAQLFASASLETVRAWMQFHYLDGFALYLGDAWREAHFDFHQRTLAGISKPRSLDRQALQFLSHYLGGPLGKLYVERYFPADSKVAMESMVAHLREAFSERIRENPWMDQATREQAFAKLGAFTSHIGYPDRWHDLSGIRIDPADLVGNIQRIREWQMTDAISKLDEPARDWEWGMTPQTINAYYSASHNEIVFPAAILQPPFFDPAADPAVNYGAIGMVIGHEISHGFDDQGSRYNGMGQLDNWWSAPSRQQFEARANRLVEQYNQYRPLPDLTVNGRLTLGENIGDLGGISVAYAALEKMLVDHPEVDQKKDGFTARQRFFLGYAQLWRALYKDEHLRQLVLTNPHSPNEFRVNGVVRNVDAWYEAFEVTEQQVLFLPPGQRVDLWQ